MNRRLRGVWLGQRPYGIVYELQEALRAARQRGDVGDTLLFLEHTPVVTLGRSTKSEHVLFDETFLSNRGIDLVKTDRGGDVTFHGPGQLVAYPIVDLRPDRCDVRRYVGDLTEVLRRCVASYGVESGPVPGMVGLWVDAKAPRRWHGPAEAGCLSKLAAIGVRISRWVTMHGFALNLTTDLSFFNYIVPCGISAHGVTSLATLTGTRLDARAAAQQVLRPFAQVFAAEAGDLEDWTSEDLSEVVSGL